MHETTLSRFRNDESGATAIEYGLICALLTVVVITAVGFLTTPVGGLFGSVPQHFENIEFPEN